MLGVDNRSSNHLLTALPALSEPAHALLRHGGALHRVTLCPRRISTIAAAALVLTSLMRSRQ